MRYRESVDRRWGILAGLVAVAACASPPGSPTASVETASASPSASIAVPTYSPSPPPALGWLELSSAGGPTPRSDYTWTVDGTGAVAYLFGGQGPDGALNDLWAFDLATDTWRFLDVHGPRARFGHNAAWVDGVGLVIFGGQRAGDFFNDLQVYVPGTTAWRELPADGDVPAPRYGSCAAVGPDGRFWISHGFTDVGRFADTRAYDFQSQSWTDETPVGDAPIKRCLHACWWTDSGEFALYGGQTIGVTALADLWRLTVGPRPGANAWREIDAKLPPARNLYAAGRWGAGTVIFGGQGRSGDDRNDLWFLPDDGAPARIQLDGALPPAREGADLIADTARGRLLLFGGHNGDGDLMDLWQLVPPAS